jgi:general secretion pathway protein G
MQTNLSFKKQMQKGFTLVELLIVVIILAILAAIVVPQFASTTTDAKRAALDSTLANIRAAIDLYYQQHAKYPGATTAVATGCTGTTGAGTGGTGANGATAFTEQLSMYTDVNGKACSVGDTTTFKYGPYLKKSTLPANPITEKNDLTVVNTGNLSMAGATGTPLGWKYDTVSGKFIADDGVGVDSFNKTYDTH